MGSFSNFGFFPKKFDCSVTEEYINFLISEGRTSSFSTQISDGRIPDIWMPPEYALAMYWRVKKWRFNYESQWVEINDPLFYWSQQIEFSIGQLRELWQDEDSSGNISTSRDLLVGTIPENENRLICGPKETEYEDFAPDDEGNIIPYNELFTHIFRGKIVGGPNVGAAGTRVLAEVIFSDAAVITRQGDNGLEMCPTITFDAETSRWVIIRARQFDGAYDNTFGTFSYKLLGQTFSSDIYAFNSRIDPPVPSDKLNVDASLEAIEYWPYDPNDGGGPIYDSTSGARIRSFP